MKKESQCLLQKVLSEVKEQSNNVVLSPRTAGNIKQQNEESILEAIDEKLGQFETDVNETLKLLYDDVESKMNEAINSSGILENQQ